MNPSPQVCPGCCHVFPPGAPEPSWCPNCGRLCSAFDEPPPPEAPPVQPAEPEECAVTPGERMRWRVWFWVLLLLGPALVLLGFPLAQAANRLLPTGLKSLLNATGPLMLLALPLICAAGSCFCLAKSQAVRRTAGELATFITLGTIGLLIAQVIMLALGCAVVFQSLR